MITLRHTTLSRTPLDEWSARRRDLYLTTRNTQQTDIPPAGLFRNFTECKSFTGVTKTGWFCQTPVRIAYLPRCTVAGVWSLSSCKRWCWGPTCCTAERSPL